MSSAISERDDAAIPRAAPALRLRFHAVVAVAVAVAVPLWKRLRHIAGLDRLAGTDAAAAHGAFRR